MKIAFLFAGQYRPIPKDLIRHSLKNLTKGLDYNIFCYAWDEPGESLDHREKVPVVKNENDSFAQISNIFSEFNLKEIHTESYNNFVVNLPNNHKKIFYSKNYHKGTIFAMPQIYTLSKCYKLLDDYKNEYDLVFRCRFDSIYLHPLNLYPLGNFLNSADLYNLNFGRAYYPNRIYDIFFGGSKKSMIFLDQIWSKLPQFVENNFNNGQDKRDACRLFFISAISNNIKIKSFNTRICDIYRPFKDNYYEQYLISSHLFSLKFNKTSVKAIPYFVKWFIYRRINLLKFSLIIVKTIFLFPISYLKRFKYYLKIYKIINDLN
tara:strand:- start:1306 stop:2265 length:960 start_codon:yes stop_codon:yes gene_type:complete